jgi:hypothetical protein
MMNSILNGFYSAYLTGSAGPGFAMLIFRRGVIVGADAMGAKYDGVYTEQANGFLVKLRVYLPPNTLLVQGATTGSEADISEIGFSLPPNFLSLPFVRVDAKHGPVNVKLVKLREIDD